MTVETSHLVSDPGHFSAISAEVSVGHFRVRSCGKPGGSIDAESPESSAVHASQAVAPEGHAISLLSDVLADGLREWRLRYPVPARQVAVCD